MSYFVSNINLGLLFAISTNFIGNGIGNADYKADFRNNSAAYFNVNLEGLVKIKKLYD